LKYYLILLFTLFFHLSPAQSQDSLYAAIDSLVGDQKSYFKFGYAGWECPEIVTVKSNYTLESEGIVRHNISNILKNNLQNCWASEIDLDSTIKITFQFQNTEQKENWKFNGEFYCFNGNFLNPKYWVKNCRIKTVKVFLNDFEESAVYLILQDTPFLQKIKLPYNVQPEDTITFELMDFYIGTDTNICYVPLLVPTCTEK